MKAYTKYARRKFLKQAGIVFTALVILIARNYNLNKNRMKANNKMYDVIIVGGSYSGLAAGRALGRALKDVLIIDDGKPCNIQTPFSHNFLTNDGNTPKEIAALASLQVRVYNTIKSFDGLVTKATKIENHFEVQLVSGITFKTKKLIFATGIKDMLPDIKGIDKCWGISVIHCPYCHGYEVRQEITGILGNGDHAFDFSRLISNWTSDLTLFTNGVSTLTVEQSESLRNHKINIVEKEIQGLNHTNGHIKNIIFNDGSQHDLKALYAPAPFIQHCTLPQELGCELTSEGYLKVDAFQETTVKGIYACGDNVTKMRTVANAVSTGTTAGMSLSKKMILEEFN